MLPAVAGCEEKRCWRTTLEFEKHNSTLAPSQTLQLGRVLHLYEERKGSRRCKPKMMLI